MHLGFFFQREQEEGTWRVLSLFLFLSFSSWTKNAEGTAPCTETSLLNSLPISEITAWQRSALLSRGKERRIACAPRVGPKIPSRIGPILCRTRVAFTDKLLMARAINLTVAAGTRITSTRASRVSQGQGARITDSRNASRTCSGGEQFAEVQREALRIRTESTAR